LFKNLNSKLPLKVTSNKSPPPLAASCNKETSEKRRVEKIKTTASEAFPRVVYGKHILMLQNFFYLKTAISTCT
jgi:hypothetical protein